jgi:outer membrane protein assembly factor BamB
MLRLAALVSLALATPTTAQDWPQLRGPGGLAVADDTPIPASFGPGDHVRWQTTIPPGHSSPCIVGGRIFVTGYQEEKNVVVAIDRASGAIAWSKTFEGPPHGEYFHPDAVPALPTAVSDGERVIAAFGNYGLVALTMDGELSWEVRLEHPGHTFGVGSSPLLFDGLLVFSRDGAPEAGILVLDAESGEELWRIDRFQAGESHGTPFLWRNKDRDELVVSTGGNLSSYDLASGERLWHVDGLTTFPCTTPTADEDTLYYAAWSTPNATGRSFWEAGFTRALELSQEEVDDPSLLFARLDANDDGKVVPDEVPECRFKDAFAFADRDQSGYWDVEEFLGVGDQTGGPTGKNLMIAVARGGSGDVSESHVRWSWTKGLPYVASPLLYKDRIWLFKSGGIASCLDAKTGKPVFDRERLDDRSEYYLSPVGAGGKVIAGSAEGTLYVLDATADDLVVEHSATFPEELFATPAVLDGVVYLRSKSTLWAFGGTEE